MDHVLISQDAVRSLNKLQTPSEVLKQIAKSGGRDNELQFQKSLKYTELVGLEVWWALY